MPGEIALSLRTTGRRLPMARRHPPKSKRRLWRWDNARGNCSVSLDERTPSADGEAPSAEVEAPSVEVVLTPWTAGRRSETTRRCPRKSWQHPETTLCLQRRRDVVAGSRSAVRESRGVVCGSRVNVRGSCAVFAGGEPPSGEVATTSLEIYATCAESAANRGGVGRSIGMPRQGRRRLAQALRPGDQRSRNFRSPGRGAGELSCPGLKSWARCRRP